MWTTVVSVPLIKSVLPTTALITFADRNATSMKLQATIVTSAIAPLKLSALQAYAETTLVCPLVQYPLLLGPMLMTVSVHSTLSVKPRNVSTTFVLTLSLGGDI